MMLFSHSVVSDSLSLHNFSNQASLSITISQNLLKVIFIESVIPHNHLVLCRPLFVLPSSFPRIRVFSNHTEKVLEYFTSDKVLELQPQHQPSQ